MDYEILTNFIFCVIIILSVVIGFNIIYERIKLEKKLVQYIVETITANDYKSISMEQFIDVVLKVSTKMNTHDQFIATYPLLSDSLKQRKNYSEKLYKMVGQSYNA